MPPGKTDLDALARDELQPGGRATPWRRVGRSLIDPAGQIHAFDTNYTVDSGGSTVTPYLVLYKSQPVPGQWSSLVYWVSPVMGVADAVPFTGAVRFDLVL